MFESLYSDQPNRGPQGLRFFLGDRVGGRARRIAGAYVRFFIDYTIDGSSLRAFLEANSYGKIGAIQNTVTCGAGTVLSDGAEILQRWADSLKGTNVVGDIFSGSFDWAPTKPCPALPGPPSSMGRPATNRDT